MVHGVSYDGEGVFRNFADVWREVRNRLDMLIRVEILLAQVVNWYYATSQSTSNELKVGNDAPLSSTDKVSSLWVREFPDAREEEL